MNKNFLGILSLSAFVFIGLMGSDSGNAASTEEAYRGCMTDKGCSLYDQDMVDTCVREGCRRACLAQARKTRSDNFYCFQ